jgi:hypothetical protein
MKWTTTTLFLLAYCARGFERTERSDKMRPIFTETQDGSRVRETLCKSVEERWKSG